jgi:D-sedoheptulose 7-phosphate isomerase
MAVLSLLLQDCEYNRRVQHVARLLARALKSGHKVLFFGNGGSAADAQHLAAELTGWFLQERQALAGITLTGNTSLLTAIANDRSFEEVFARQIEAIGNPGDIAFAISTSGRSKNVLRAVEAARKKKLVTVGLTGGTGRLRDMVEHCICVPSDQVPRIQEAHILTGHILCELIEQAFVKKNRRPAGETAGKAMLQNRRTR